ncbi:GGDEF domain-containing protein [Phyllobacterium phragmitis]|uniref:GGDEF domain-containing protein n=1 Tax=Phyllobacterium phragmitis TaxID=2670329 RepID=A0A2S9IRU9_9HYPH|nr:bifunctional diguanylate cyclase/phosphodiesterase [Phyllobacterium phragmitis]PRD43246.1 GGDEF domain-containing protein [Phyllobacterium phragmitis]
MANSEPRGIVGGPAEAAETDEDFRVLFTTHPTPMWVYDPQTLKFLIINQAAVELYGYDREQFRQLTVLDIRPPAERERMLDAISERTDLDRPQRWQHLKADGEIIEVLTYGRQVRFRGLDAVLAIVQDRTEVNQAYKQVHHTRSLLDNLVSNLPLGVFVKDMESDGRYVLFNEAAGSISGRTPAEVLGKTDSALYPRRDVIRLSRQDKVAMRRSEVLSLEQNMVRPDGQVRIVRTIKRRIPASDGSRPRYLIGLAEDVTERREILSRIEHVAMHDALTGLPNRAYFTDHVGKLLKNEHEAEPFALLYLDVDHFKQVNDSMGHPAGDMLLREVASRLRKLVSPDDFIARIDGDEFALAFMGGDTGDISLFAEKLMAAFAEPFRLDHNEEYVCCSIGIALAPKHGDEVDLLLRNADLALHAAKADGRSTFRFYEQSMRLAAEKRHLLTLELRQALNEGQFELYYQPIFTLADDSISGFEALIRWHHPQRGMVSPAEFIPVAEETGLISGIGQWVLRKACMTAARWPKSIKISVNLSAAQFDQAGLLDTVVMALEEADLEPHRLELEITESIFLSNSRQNIQLLYGLRDLGVRIAMDDFGTGYSSLSYLSSFPFDKIKIDRSFVSGIEVDTRNLAIIQAVAVLGAGFNIITTAEGVETAQQLTRLRHEQFGEVQGFLTGRPMPASEIDTFISSKSASSSRVLNEPASSAMTGRN